MQGQCHAFNQLASKAPAGKLTYVMMNFSRNVTLTLQLQSLSAVAMSNFGLLRSGFFAGSIGHQRLFSTIARLEQFSRFLSHEFHLLFGMLI